jgi:hypothetical protein
VTELIRVVNSAHVATSNSCQVGISRIRSRCTNSASEGLFAVCKMTDQAADEEGRYLTGLEDPSWDQM